MLPQLILWDPDKARRNLEKHGVDFEEASTIFRDPLLLVMQDLEHSQEEERWLALGMSVRQLLLVVAHTENEEAIRIISARRAESKERRDMSSGRKPVEKDDEMRNEYDFTNAVRGKYVKRFPSDVVMVTLAPDVAAAFPDADSVNEALRVLLKAAKKVAPAA